MNDKELDRLIKENFERDEMCKDISRCVMKQINRTERRRSVRKLKSMVAVAFGAPLLGAGGLWGIYNALVSAETKSAAALLVFAALTLVCSTTACVLKFSSEKL